mgnify:CR=1 FL=1
MKVFETIKDVQSAITQLKAEGKTIGFVPTMGALHEGHLSLVRRSKKETDISVVSIFVNPIQFNDKNDLKNYPRIIDQDIKMLSSANADILFYPGEQEMYPEPCNDKWDFGAIEKVMEGAHRPGHFNGVAIVVKKLFEIVTPHKAYFGLKDFQQLAVIKQLVIQTKSPVEIIPCTIVRENDGLAMSSRNILLSLDERIHAANISRTLFLAKSDFKSKSIKETIDFVVNTLNADPYMNVEYFEIVDDTYLQPVMDWNQPGVKVGCVAVKIGKVRLIDNIIFND